MWSRSTDGSSVEDMFLISKKGKKIQNQPLSLDEKSFVHELGRIDKCEKNINEDSTQRVPAMFDLYRGQMEAATGRKNDSLIKRPTDVKKIINEGRLRLIILLNSYGGKGVTWLNPLENLASRISSRAGDIVTIWGSELCSAAAYAWMLGWDQQHQFCLKKSNILFHLSTLCYGENSFVDEDGFVDEELDKTYKNFHSEQEMSEIKELLLARAKPDYHADIHQKIDTANKNSDTAPDRPIIFTGQEAEDMGFWRSVETPEELKSIFQEVSWAKNMHLGQMWSFFKYSEFSPMHMKGLLDLLDLFK